MQDVKIVDAKTLFPGLDKPSLHALSYALRHPDTWPKGFVWNYDYCDSCAIGLANALWNLGFDFDGNHDDFMSRHKTNLARQFAMPYKDASRIFVDANRDPSIKRFGVFPRSMSAITPDMVADLIDGYLKTAE